MKFILSKIGLKSHPKKDSGFSRFFREAPSREKKRVFMDVARKASAEQIKLMRG